MECSLCGCVHDADRSCASEPEESRIGQVIAGKYRVVRRIGDGGMATVYEATHVDIRRAFALKFLRKELCDDEALLARFRSEASAAGALESEHIAAVVDFGVSPDGAPYIVMELLRGEDLHARLSRGTLVHPEEAIDIAHQACLGLQVAHDAKVIHRDLKPANVFLCTRGDEPPLVKLLDFGVARVLDAAIAQQTNTGMVMGTAWYMSPEQARGEREVGPRADIYGLGVVLYEMLAGTRPFHADNYNALLHRITTEDPPSLQARCPVLSHKLCAVVERALARTPEDRFATASEFAVALRPFTRTALQRRADAVKGSEQPEDSDKPELTSVQFAARGESSNSTSATTATGPGVDTAIPMRRLGVPLWAIAVALLTVALFFVWRPGQPSSPEPASAVVSAEVPGASFAEVPPLPPAPSEVPVDDPADEEAPAEPSAEGSVSLMPSSVPSLAQLSSVPVASASTPLRVESAVAATFPASSGGFLNVNSIPPSEVFIDGKSVGTTPRVSLPVRAGKHTVVVVHPERGRLNRTVTVDEGETKVVGFRFPELEPVVLEPAPPVATVAPKCNPNWYVDQDGIRRVKPECLNNPYR